MTEAYEKALVKYHSTLRIVPVPLMCWDIFASYSQELNNYNAIQSKWHIQENFNAIVYQQKRDIIVTNVNQEIVFATQGIHEMNGYHAFELIGKSPKIFQGELTSAESKNKIRTAIKNQLPFKDIILNYKKDGSTYLCDIEAFPKFNKKGVLINYVAFEKIAS